MPHALYQAATIDINLVEERLSGHTTLWLAFLADLGLIVFFLFYTMAFTWCFDQVFGLPSSARGPVD